MTKPTAVLSFRCLSARDSGEFRTAPGKRLSTIRSIGQRLHPIERSGLGAASRQYPGEESMKQGERRHGHEDGSEDDILGPKQDAADQQGSE